MLAAPDDYLAAEGQQVADPKFGLFLSPYPYPTGFVAGSGTLVNGSLAAGLFSVVYGADSASWTGPVVANPAEILPAAAALSWELAAPGYHWTAAWRTAPLAAALESQEWQPLTLGASLELLAFYQLRFTWTSIRAWVYDTLEAAEAAADSFWAVDDLPDDHASYACDGPGNLAYLRNLTLTGEYQLPPDDVLDGGELQDSLGDGFGQIVAGNYTAILINREGRYSPGEPNFLFGEEDWRRRTLTLRQWYAGPDGVTGAIEKFVGTVMIWQDQEGIDPDGKAHEAWVEISADNLVAKLLERQIGMDADDGTPNPWTCGEFMREAAQLADQSPEPPDAVADAETGDTSQFTTVQVAGTGSSLTVVTGSGSEGSLAYRAQAQAANAVARGELELAVTGRQVLLTAQLTFAAVPAQPIHLNLSFMGLFGGPGPDLFALGVGGGGQVFLYSIGGGWVETKWNINAYVGVPQRLSLCLDAKAAGLIKFIANGSEQLSLDGNYSTFGAIRGGYAGLALGASPQPWDLIIDDLQISPGWERYAYRIYGHPFQSFGTVYQDGVVQVNNPPATVGSGSWGRSGSDPTRLEYKFAGGQAVPDDRVVKRPELGVVIFTDYANPPQGTIIVQAVKDDNTHPGDIVPRILTEAGEPEAVDLDSCLETKALLPADQVGLYLSNTTLGEALKTLGQRCLLNYRVSGRKLVLLPYDGTADRPCAAQIANWTGYVRRDDQSSLKSRSLVKHSWNQLNPKLLEKATDAAALARVGLITEEIDLSHGGDVSSGSQTMARQKAPALLNRVRGGDETLQDFLTPHTHGRLEVGDLVRVLSPRLQNQFYSVWDKQQKCAADKSIRMILRRFLGEPGPLFGCGPAAFWDFRNNLNDLSGRDHTLQWQGGGSPWYLPGFWEPGPTAVYLDGDHYCSCPDHPDFNPGAGPFTVEILFQCPAVNGEKQTLLSKLYLPDGSYRGFHLDLDADLHLRGFAIETIGAAAWRQLIGAAALTPLTWYYAAQTWDPAADLRLYLQGLPYAGTYGGTVAAWNTSCAAPLNIGRYSDGHAAEPLTCPVDLVIFHNNLALTAAQIDRRGQQLRAYTTLSLINY
jgi:hypothetical protein